MPFDREESLTSAIGRPSIIPRIAVPCSTSLHGMPRGRLEASDRARGEDMLLELELPGAVFRQDPAVRKPVLVAEPPAEFDVAARNPHVGGKRIVLPSLIAEDRVRLGDACACIPT